MPVPKLPSLEKRAEQALKRLKVNPEALNAAPQITPTIKNCVKGGLKAALGAMLFAAQDEVIAAFLKKYYSIPVGDRDRVPWEAIALAAKVNMNHLAGSILLAVSNHAAMRSRFIAVSNHPRITQARVKYGKMASGERDRTQLDIMVGALPSAKGPTFIGKAVFGSGGSGGGTRDRDDDGETPTTPAQVVYQGGDIEDRIFGTSEMNNDLDNKLVKIRDRRLDL
jgi:hypothetical protein